MTQTFLLFLVPTATASLFFLIRSFLILFPPSPKITVDFHPDELTGLRFHIPFVKAILRSLLLRLRLLGRPGLVRDRSVDHPSEKEDMYRLEGGKALSLDMPFRLCPLDIDQYRLAVGRDLPEHANADIPEEREGSMDWFRRRPLHLPLFLGAKTFPGILLLMSHSACPLDPVGSVNVRNRMEVGVERCLEVLGGGMQGEEQVGGEARGLRVRTRLEPRAKRVKRGWEWAIVCDLVVSGSSEGAERNRPLPEQGSACLADDKHLLFRQTFTLLEFAKHLRAPLQAEAAPGPSAGASNPPPTSLGQISLSLADPGRWAILSQDYNPIHMSSPAARLLGFSGRIAHGNHVVAKSIELVDPALKEEGSTGEGRLWVETEFKRPTLLPAVLEVYRTGSGEDEARAGGRRGGLEIGQMAKVNVTVLWGRA